MELNILNVLIAIIMLVLALVLDLVLGDPSPNYPDKWVFKLHPTVLMGKFTKKIEPVSYTHLTLPTTPYV